MKKEVTMSKKNSQNNITVDDSATTDIMHSDNNRRKDNSVTGTPLIYLGDTIVDQNTGFVLKYATIFKNGLPEHIVNFCKKNTDLNKDFVSPEKVAHFMRFKKGR